MNATWYDIGMFHFLWLLPALLLVFGYAAWRRKQALERFAGSVMLKRLAAGVSPARRLWKKAFLLGGILLLVLAMARPAWNPVPREVRRRGRDVAFVLDVSRSMLADDLKPSRLERAKLAIQDCIDVLEGDRVALVVFAGNAVVRCPLTQDYGFFRMMLGDIGCDSVSRGGTLIGDALRKVEREVFDRRDRQCKDIVLITDGEDHESFPVDAARRIGREGIRLIAVGLGDDAAGTPIVVPGRDGRKEILKYRGEIVRSRLDSGTLREMVSATPGGRYLPVATGNIDLGGIYRSLIAGAEKHDISSETIQRYEEKFQIFLLLAMVLLALSVGLDDRRRAAAMLLLLAGGLACPGRAAPAGLRRGNRLLRENRFPEALKSYRDAAVGNPESPYLHYNQGLASYRMEDFPQAEKEFRKALETLADRKRKDPALEAKCRLGLANAYYRLAQRQKDSDPRKTIEAVRKSLDELSDLTLRHPDLQVAARNLRSIRLILKKLQNDLRKQQKEQQKRTQQARKQSQKLGELARRQGQEAGRSGEAARKDDRSDQTRRDLSGAQQEIGGETARLDEEAAKSQPPPPGRKELQDAIGHQRKAEEALDRMDYQEAAREQSTAAEDLRKAKDAIDRRLQDQQRKEDARRQADEQRKAAGEKAKQQQQQQQQEKQQQEKQEQQQKDGADEKDGKDGKDGKDSPERKPEQFNLSESPEDILDEERRNNRERRGIRGLRQRPVDKDW